MSKTLVALFTILALGVGAWFFWPRDHAGLTVSLSAEECSAMGGRLDSDLGCVVMPSEEECRAMGGRLDSSLGCTKETSPEETEAYCKAAGMRYVESVNGCTPN